MLVCARVFQSENRNNSLRDSDTFCQYCHKRGHWKADCYVLKSKPTFFPGASAKGTGLAVPVRSSDASSLDETTSDKVKLCVLQC